MYYRKPVDIELPYCAAFGGNVELGDYSSVSKRGNATEWENCRELFQRERRRTRGILLYHERNRGRDVAAFIAKVEKRIGLKDKSVFHATTNRRATYVEVPKFWRRQSMRFSLYTLLLRCGLNYRRNRGKRRGFVAALNSEWLSETTMPAIRRFLKGYTYYTGRVNGWHNQFYDVCGGWEFRSGDRDDMPEDRDDMPDYKKLSKLLKKRKPRQ